MIPFVIGAAALGALAMGKTKPKTRATKCVMFGPHSGQTYQVEDFKDAGFVVVMASDGSRGVFRKRAITSPGMPGLEWQNGTGNRHTLGAMIVDICGKPEKKAEPEKG